MAKLIYSLIEGYVADEDGYFDWAEPDEEVHVFINDLDEPNTQLAPSDSVASRSTRVHEA